MFGMYMKTQTLYLSLSPLFQQEKKLKYITDCTRATLKNELRMKSASHLCSSHLHKNANLFVACALVLLCHIPRPWRRRLKNWNLSKGGDCAHDVCHLGNCIKHESETTCRFQCSSPAGCNISSREGHCKVVQVRERAPKDLTTAYTIRCAQNPLLPTGFRADKMQCKK
jgi:hypothetical protein